MSYTVLCSPCLTAAFTLGIIKSCKLCSTRTKKMNYVILSPGAIDRHRGNRKGSFLSEASDLGYQRAHVSLAAAGALEDQ